MLEKIRLNGTRCKCLIGLHIIVEQLGLQFETVILQQWRDNLVDHVAVWSCAHADGDCGGFALRGVQAFLGCGCAVAGTACRNGNKCCSGKYCCGDSFDAVRPLENSDGHGCFPLLLVLKKYDYSVTGLLASTSALACATMSGLWMAKACSARCTSRVRNSCSLHS